MKMETISQLAKIFDTHVFSIGVCVVCFVVIFKLVKYYNSKTEEREKALMHELSENRKINAKAIETIGKYADRLDKIENDVDDIKENIIVIKEKI